MKNLFGQIKKNNSQGLSATYHIGLLQTRAFKAIMGQTSELLSKLDITNVDWVALGIIYDHNMGLRSTVLARTLGIEQAYITVLTAKLNKRGLLTVSSDPTDKRAKIIHISKKGKSFVKQTEAMLSKEMGKISVGISTQDADAYLRVLQAIVDSTEKK